MKPKPLTKFRVYGWNSSLFFYVIIWPTLNSLRKEYERKDKGSGRDCMGFVRPVRVYKINEDKSHRVKPIVGEIHLCVKNLTTEIIVHEATHAAIKLLNRIDSMFEALDYKNDKSSITINGSLNGEEAICYMTGHFSKQIVNRIYKLKFLVEAENGHKKRTVRQSSRRRKNNRAKTRRTSSRSSNASK